RERRGTNSIVRTGFRVRDAASLSWWESRFDELQVPHSRVHERDERPVLDFEDGEGQRLSLRVDPAPGETHPWDRSPVPVEHQLLGLGPITISVPVLAPTERVLTDVLQMRKVRDYT